jgi:hypothetical protein
VPSTRCRWTARSAIGATVALLCLVSLAGASRASSLRAVRYHGIRLIVPAGWPVIRLAEHPRACVRFDRHAVYLGAPGSDQACGPGGVAGRTEAILVAPRAARAATQGLPDAGDVARISRPSAGVVITATWRDDPGAIRRALGLRTLDPYRRAAEVRPAAAVMRSAMAFSRRSLRARRTASAPGQIYSGQGFDACATPSAATMSRWSASPYRAVGVYIGGENMACSQPNLTPSWVSAESSAGWHLIPIFVGLQAPGNDCGCQAMSASSAAAQGTSDAQDAVAQAQAIGIGTGNPIFDDMEAYPRGGSTSTTVLDYLGAWTKELNSLGYLSGIYSSDDSGIADLVDQLGSSFDEPQELWFANWNGEANTEDSVIPTDAWASGERLHQFEGGVNQSYGGVEMNIDRDQLDSATAAYGSTTGAPIAPPAPILPPTLTGAPLVGQTLHDASGTYSNDPTSFTDQWELCDSAGGDCVALAGVNGTSYTIGPGAVGDTIRIVQSASNAAGTSTANVSPATGVVTAMPSSGYYLYTRWGQVYAGPGTSYLGEAVSSVPDVVGLAVKPSHGGYWIATDTGAVFAYGDAKPVTPGRYRYPIRGVVAGARSGLYLFTAEGNVFQRNGARFEGSPYHSGLHLRSIIAMAIPANGRGYWLVGSGGEVYSYGGAPALPYIHLHQPIAGASASPTGGLWVYGTQGAVLALGGAATPGPATSEPGPSGGVVGLAPTSDGGGYWLTTSSGAIYPYGDAATFAAPSHAHPIAGIAAG